MMRSRSTPPLLLAFGLAACTVTPRDAGTTVAFPPPRAPLTIAPASGPVQRVEPALVPAQWWHAFGSPKLDALVSKALVANNDVATAEATLRQAQEQARVSAGAQGPQIDANYQAQRAQIAQVLATPLADATNYHYTLHTAQLTVSYPVDLFGLGRNRVRSARAAAEVAAARLDAARLTVVANLVLAVIQRASLEAQVAATRAAIASNGELVTLLRRRRALGDIAASDVTAQETSLANAEAALPPLERQLRHQSELIQTLTGAPAGSPLPPFPTFAELSLPATLPLALPSDVVASRPDVRAAAAQVRGAAADLGASMAARLPSIQLTGNAGGSATNLLHLADPANLFWTVLGSLTQPLFHSGQLKHQERASRAALDVAKSQYRVAALQAFLDVDDAIAGLRTDAAAVDAAARADAAARLTLTFTRRQVELGAVGTLALLTASAAASQAAAQLIQAKAARLSDSVALFQAIGAQPQ